MPRNPRRYDLEAAYDNSEKRKKARAERNKARRMMEKAGKVHKGDGKDVDHKHALSKGGKTTPSNLRVVSATKNRSYARTKTGKMK